MHLHMLCVFREHGTVRHICHILSQQSHGAYIIQTSEPLYYHRTSIIKMRFGSSLRAAKNSCLNAWLITLI